VEAVWRIDAGGVVCRFGTTYSIQQKHSGSESVAGALRGATRFFIGVFALRCGWRAAIAVILFYAFDSRSPEWLGRSNQLLLR